MLKIRLLRTGKKHDPSFRVVLTDSRNAAQSGRFIEILGNYNAQKGEPELKAERIKEWISKGAQVSDTVHNILISKNIIEGKKRDVLHHAKIKSKLEKKKPKEEQKPAEKPKPAEENKKEEPPAAKEPAEAAVDKVN